MKAGLGWIDLAITAVSFGVSLWQGAKAKKAKKAAKEAKEAEERRLARQRAYQEYLQRTAQSQQQMDVLITNKIDEESAAKTHEILKYVSYAATAGCLIYMLVKRSRNKKKKKK